MDDAAYVRFVTEKAHSVSALCPTEFNQIRIIKLACCVLKQSDLQVSIWSSSLSDHDTDMSTHEAVVEGVPGREKEKSPSNFKSASPMLSELPKPLYVDTRL